MPSDASSLVLRWLGQRNLTYQELRWRLSERGFDGDLIEDVLSGLGAGGWIDDRRVADEVVRYSLARHEGPAHMTARLIRRGVAVDVRQQVMSDVMDEVDWLAIALPLAERYDRDSPKGRQRLIRHMRREGFATGIIRQVLAADGGDITDGVEDY